MGPLDRTKIFPRAREVGSKPFELFEVERGQHFQSFGTLFGEMQANNAMVLFVSGSSDQTCRFSTVDETDGAVVQKQQVVSDLADGRATRITVSTHS